MSVITVRRRHYLSDYSQGKGCMSEGAQFMAGAGLTLLGPTLLYCAAIGQLWPLYLMAVNEILGVVLGVLVFKKSSEIFLSCVPVTCVPNIPRGAGGLKRAA
jgi:hypothetical protein